MYEYHIQQRRGESLHKIEEESKIHFFLCVWMNPLIIDQVFHCPRGFTSPPDDYRPPSSSSSSSVCLGGDFDAN